MAGDVDKLMAEFLSPTELTSGYVGEEDPAGHWRRIRELRDEGVWIKKDMAGGRLIAFSYSPEIDAEAALYFVAALDGPEASHALIARLRLIADRMEQLLAARERDESNQP